MPRSDVFWDKSAPEWEPEDREDRMERLTREEMKTRVIESQVDLLLGIIESYREGWKQ
jgi:hypothetical protein